MRITSSCNFLQTVDDKIKITSEDGSSFIVVPFDPLVIATKRSRAKQEWTKVLVGSCDLTSSKSYFIALEALQLIVDKSEQQQAASVREAAYNGQIESLEVMLSQGTISIETRSDALLDAVNKGLTGIVQKLLDDGPILPDDQCEAFKVAIWHEYGDILKLILAQNVILPEMIAQELIKEAQEGNLEIFCTLFKAGHICCDDQNKAFILAASQGHVDIVKFLLAQEQISCECACSAFETAALKGDLEIFSLLLASELISDTVIDRVFIQALKDRSSQIVTAFLQSAQVSESCLNQVFIEQKANRDLLVRRYASAPLLYKDRLYVHPQDFSQYPAPYLAALAKYRLKPITFLLDDGSVQPGVDAGGLTKEFLSKLTEHLLINEVIEIDALRFPCLRASNFKYYTQLGQLLSHVDAVNKFKTDLLFIGEMFDPRTYDLLQLLAQPLNPLESAQARKHRELIALAQVIATAATQDLVDFLTQKNPSVSDRAAIESKLVEAGQDVEKGLSVDDLKQLCFESLALESYYAPLAAILKGVRRPLKVKILAQGGQIAKSLQGEITRQLLDKLECHSGHPIVVEKTGWLKEKLIEELEDPKKIWVKKFLQCVTAQSVTPTTSIQIIESLDTMCHARTCFNQLSIPTIHETEPHELTLKQRFIHNLNLTLDQGAGFGSI